MQNASSSGPTPGAGSGHNWATPALPDMYTSHQRTSSNPRPYAAAAADIVGTDTRRDEAGAAGHGVYPGGEGGYAGYQSGAGYGASGNVAYGYSGGMGLPAYNSATASPPRSRRASGPKPASSPPPASPATNTSPSSRYYSSQQPQAADVIPAHAQAPYQSSSAPPQVVSHHHAMSGQPQTAHPYGGGYYNYYDQSQQHQTPGQWPSHYPQTGSHGFQQQQPSPARPAQQAGSNTPSVNPASSHHSHRPTPSASSSNTFDYSSSGGPSPYPVWAGQESARNAGHQQQTWQTPVSGGRMGGSGGQGQTMTQSQWQGYAGHPAMPAQGMAQHQVNPGQVPAGQYAWPQWNAQSYGYPSTTSHQSHAGQPGVLPGVHGTPSMPAGAKKHKKDKKSGIVDPAEYQGLGKRLADSGEDDGDERKEGKSKKKGKKEEEKFPKLPAKSQLHPPRQAQSAWQLFFSDELNKAKAAAAQDASPGGTLHHAKLNVAQIAKDAGASYANLDEEQRVYYTQKVLESKESYAKDLAEWQATLTPEDIRAENAFRAQQRKEGKSRKGNLKDPNAPKKPLSAYFLFLKGIRENDDLRANVWGEETETTKQSVLAAERWRGLSVDEKKPYLQQAERDKQDYETQRKLYEGDAAARARGEDVPLRTLPIPDLPIKLELPKPRKQGPVTVKPDPQLKGEDAVDPDFGEFTHEDSSDHIEGEGRSMEIEDFPGFHDPLEDIDLSGFHQMSGDTAVEHGGQWGDLHHLMGGLPDERKVVAPIESSTAGDVEVGENPAMPPASLDQEMGAPIEESADVSVAPTLTEAVGETSELAPALGSAPASLPLDPGPAVPLEIVAEDEGALSVPMFESESTFTNPDNAADSSGVPTEEVNELPPADLPPTIDELPMSTVDQVRSASSPELPTAEAMDAPQSTPLGLVNSLITAEANAEQSAPPATEERTTYPAGSFETAMLSGEIAPEAVHEEDITSAPATVDGSSLPLDESEPEARIDGD